MTNHAIRGYITIPQLRTSMLKFIFYISATLTLVWQIVTCHEKYPLKYTPQWIVQQLVMIESWFNFLDIPPVSSEYLCNIRTLELWWLKSDPTCYEGFQCTKSSRSSKSFTYQSEVLLVPSTWLESGSNPVRPYTPPLLLTYRSPISWWCYFCQPSSSWQPNPWKTRIANF